MRFIQGMQYVNKKTNINMDSSLINNKYIEVFARRKINLLNDLYS